jgi:hypothetical protein
VHKHNYDTVETKRTERGSKKFTMIISTLLFSEQVLHIDELATRLRGRTRRRRRRRKFMEM